MRWQRCGRTSAAPTPWTSGGLCGGLLGGATVAWILAETTGAVAGVIAAGAPDRPDAKLLPKSVAWFATAGRADFNFIDTKRTAARLERAEISDRIEFFDGGHQWMPSGLATRGLAWLESRAMADGRRAKDPELARALIDEELAYARGLEQAGALTDALRVYSTVVSDYGGAGDVAAAAARKNELGRDERLKAAAREEQRIDSREHAVVTGISKTLRGLFEPELPLPAQLVAALGINGLRREAEGKGRSGIRPAKSRSAGGPDVVLSPARLRAPEAVRPRCPGAGDRDCRSSRASAAVAGAGRRSVRNEPEGACALGSRTRHRGRSPRPLRARNRPAIRAPYGTPDLRNCLIAWRTSSS